MIDTRLWTCPGCGETYRIRQDHDDPVVCARCVPDEGEAKREPGSKSIDWICPHCAYRFSEEPKRKRKCPDCGGRLFRWSDPDIKGATKILVTESQLRELQRKWIRKHARRELQELKKNGVPRAEIIAALDNRSCEACIEDDGAIWPVDIALREMPIPHNGDGDCRCIWAGVIRNAEANK